MPWKLTRPATRAACCMLWVTITIVYELTGVLIEYAKTAKIFTTPADQRTEDYVTGRFG